MLKTVDKATETYARLLDTTLNDLNNKVVATLGKAKTDRDRFDAATILNSRGDFITALRESGYTELANKHVEKYKQVIDEVKEDFKDLDLPPPKFTAANTERLKAIARSDLENFNAIGTDAMDTLRQELFRQAVAAEPFENMVNKVREKTTGIGKDGSPLKNHSYTHANTAILRFNGEVIREAGDSLGAKKWEVVGPLDSVTRDVCRTALGDPIRTAEEWKAAGYWGGAPGGWNCRHQLYPVFK